MTSKVYEFPRGKPRNITGKQLKRFAFFIFWTIRTDKRVCVLGIGVPPKRTNRHPVEFSQRPSPAIRVLQLCEQHGPLEVILGQT